MFPMLHIGPIAIQTPILFLLIGIWCGLFLIEKQVKTYHIDPTRVSTLVILALVSGILGARAAFIARFPEIFLANPGSIFSLNPLMLDASAGLFVGVLVSLLYGQQKRLSFWSTLDSLTGGLAVFAIFIGLSHFASGAAYGEPTRLPWAVHLWGEYRHPTQIYEILAALLILAVIYRPDGYPHTMVEGDQDRGGLRFLTFASLYALSRIFLEGFRGDSTLFLNLYRSGQIIAWICLAIFLLLIGLRLPKTQSQEYQPAGSKDIDHEHGI